MKTMIKMALGMALAMAAGSMVNAQEEVRPVTAGANIEMQAGGYVVRVKQVKDDLFAGTEKFATGASDVAEINLDPKMMGMVHGNGGSELVARCAIACGQLLLLRPRACRQSEYVGCTQIAVPGGSADDRCCSIDRNRAPKKVAGSSARIGDLLLLHPGIDRDRVRCLAVAHQESNAAVLHCHAAIQRVPSRVPGSKAGV